MVRSLRDRLQTAMYDIGCYHALYGRPDTVVRPPFSRADAAARRAVTVSGKTKRQLVEEAVRAHLQEDGLVVGRVALREEVPEVMTLDEAAALLRVEPPALERAARGGEVPGRQIAGSWRFSKAALVAWLNDVEGAAK